MHKKCPTGPYPRANKPLIHSHISEKFCYIENSTYLCTRNNNEENMT